jgi:hypothetical protein
MMAPKGTLTKSLTVEDSILPKDQAELELEKLVFGDEEGFRENVRHQAALDSASSEEDESEHSFNRRVLEKDNIGPGSGSDNLEGVEDSDVSLAMPNSQSQLMYCSCFSSIPELPFQMALRSEQPRTQRSLDTTPPRVVKSLLG